MSVTTQVMRRTGASRADIVRVAAHGGITAADWGIAHAIEQITGRPAADIMWGHPGDFDAPAVESTNPHAVHDPQVRIYDEPTAPDAPQTALPDHPHETDDTPEPVDEIDDQDETDPGRAAWNAFLHTHVWADVAALTGGAPGEIARTVRPWATARDAMAGMTALIARRRAARTPRRNTIAAALAA